MVGISLIESCWRQEKLEDTKGNRKPYI